MAGFRSMQPGFASRTAAFVLAGLLVLELQADLARWLANPRSADHGVVRAERVVESLEPEAAPVVAPVTTAEPAPAPAVERVAASVSRPQVDRVPLEATLAAPIVADAGPPDAVQSELRESSDVERLAARCETLLEQYDRAEEPDPRRSATLLLRDSGGSAELLAALRDPSQPTGRAELMVIRTLLLAEREEQARELAREARLSDPEDTELGAAIHELGLLRPRIVKLDPIVGAGDRLELRGTVRNEDIGAVRKVKVRAEALDGEGNVVATSTTRVKPKLIDASVEGAFVVRFARAVDASRVSRTRVTVVAYEYEVAQDN